MPVGPWLARLRLLAVVLAVLAVLVLAPMRAASAASYPAITTAVVDRAGVLTPDELAVLARRLEAHQRANRVQVAILTIGSTGDEDLEGYAYHAAQAWRGGDAKADSGVLVVLDTGRKKSRIEVGKGLGGALTDLEASDVLAAARPDLHAGRYAAGLGTIVDGILARTAGASTAAKDGSDAARWQAEQARIADTPGGFPMPWSILGVVLAGTLATTLVMQRLPFWWEGLAAALALGAVLVPAAFHALAFWPTFYAPWATGVLVGAVVGRLAREERLTAVLLALSAALAGGAILIPYKAATDWKPPWGVEDVCGLAVVELLVMAIGTWLVAPVVLAVAGLLVAVPVNLIVSPALPTDDGVVVPGVRETVNTWFKERFGIVFGILGIFGEVAAAGGDSKPEREGRRSGSSSRREKRDDYRGGGGTFGGGGASDDF